MLAQILEGLTAEQKHALEALDIPKSRRSEWKNGKRRPTAAQAMTVALVAGIDPQPLLQWLAEQEATPAQRGLFRHAAERVGRIAAAAAGAVILSAMTFPKSSYASKTYEHFGAENTIYIVALWNTLRRRLKKLLTREMCASSTAPKWGLFFGLAKPKANGC